MCNPAYGVAALQFIGSNASINAQNANAEQTAVNANAAANDEYASTTKQYIEQNRSLIQGGFDAVLQGREDEALAYTSAIENGVQGASVKAVLRDSRQSTGRSTARTSQEIASLRTQVGANLDHIESKAQGRINSASPTGFNLGDAAQVLSPILRSQTD